MKTRIKPYLLLAAMLFCGFGAITAHADGGETGGGGDLQCDSKIKEISGNIESWIRSHGPESGSTPLNLTTSLNPLTKLPYSLTDYEHGMLKYLNLPLDVSCVSAGDPGYPVQVGGVIKVCKNFVDSSGVHMTCDLSRFLKMSQDEQIQQIHHEFAINVPGLEPDFGSLSTYKISTQLSAFTDDVTERRLVVRVTPSANGVLGHSCRPLVQDWETANDRFQSLVAQAVEPALSKLGINVVSVKPGTIDYDGGITIFGDGIRMADPGLPTLVTSDGTILRISQWLKVQRGGDSSVAWTEPLYTNVVKQDTEGNITDCAIYFDDVYLLQISNASSGLLVASFENGGFKPGPGELRIPSQYLVHFAPSN